MKIKCGSHSKCQRQSSARAVRSNAQGAVQQRAQSAGRVLGRISSLPRVGGQPISVEAARQAQAERAFAEQQMRAAREAELRFAQEQRREVSQFSVPARELSEQQQHDMALALSLSEQDAADERRAAQQEDADLALALELSELEHPSIHAQPRVPDGAGAGPSGSPPPYDYPHVPAVLPPPGAEFDRHRAHEPSAPPAELDPAWRPIHPVRPFEPRPFREHALLVPPPYDYEDVPATPPPSYDQADEGRYPAPRSALQSVPSSPRTDAPLVPRLDQQDHNRVPVDERQVNPIILEQPPHRAVDPETLEALLNEAADEMGLGDQIPHRLERDQPPVEVEPERPVQPAAPQPPAAVPQPRGGFLGNLLGWFFGPLMRR